MLTISSVKSLKVKFLNIVCVDNTAVGIIEVSTPIAEIIGSSNRKKSKRELPDFSTNTINGDGILDLDGGMFSSKEREDLISELTGEMLAAAEALEFERAAELRDRIKELKKD